MYASRLSTQQLAQTSAVQANQPNLMQPNSGPALGSSSKAKTPLLTPFSGAELTDMLRPSSFTRRPCAGQPWPAFKAQQGRLSQAARRTVHSCVADATPRIPGSCSELVTSEAD